MSVYQSSLSFEESSNLNNICGIGEFSGKVEFNKLISNERRLRNDTLLLIASDVNRAQPIRVHLRGLEHGQTVDRQTKVKYLSTMLECWKMLKMKGISSMSFFMKMQLSSCLGRRMKKKNH